MGQQQLLLIILGIIIIGIAIAVGITLFSTQNISSNKDNVTIQMTNIAADAFAYYQRAKILGGGGGNLAGYVIMPGLDSTLDGAYTIVGSTKDTLFLLGTSRYGFGTVTATANYKGLIPSSIVYSGQFLNN